MSIEHPYTFDLRPEVVAVLPPSPRLLDVGCSRGGFARGIREGAASVGEVWGIEPNADAATEAAKHMDRVLVGTYPDALPAGETFDTIVFNDVLEHMPDPWEALRQTHGFLRPGGRVVASIPNIRYWPVVWDLIRRGRWEYTETGTLDRTHLRFFTRSSAIEMLTGTGYVVERVGVGYQLDARRRNLARALLPVDFRTQQYVFVVHQQTGSFVTVGSTE